MDSSERSRRGTNARPHGPLAACLLLPVLVLAGACVHYHARPLSPADNATRLAARTLADPGLRQFLEANEQRALAGWPLPSWGFADLSLAAFYYHPDLDVARAEWSVAQAGEVTAGQRPNPTLNVVPGYNTTTSVPSPWLPFVGLDIPIETGGKRRHRLAGAQQLSEAARLRVASVAWQVRSRVRISLVALHRATERQRLLQEQDRLQADIVGILERQHDVGEVSAFELTRARIAADETRLILHEAERDTVTGRVQLAEALGIGVGALEGVEISYAGLDEAPPPESIAEARVAALTSRSDLLAALAEYEAAQAALQLEISKQYPDIHLGPGYQYDQGENKWTLGIGVTLPIFNRNHGPIAEAEARRTESAARFDSLQNRIVAEVDRDVATYRFAGRQQADAEELLGELRKQESREAALLEAGEVSKSDLVSLRLQVNAADLAHVEALAGALGALSALEDALQRPLSVPVTAWQDSPRQAEGPQRGDEHP